MMKNLALLGVIFILIGIVFVIISSVYVAIRDKSNVRSAGIVFLGPIPLGWASDKKMFYVLIVLFVLSFVMWFLLRR